MTKTSKDVLFKMVSQKMVSQYLAGLLNFVEHMVFRLIWLCMQLYLIYLVCSLRSSSLTYFFSLKPNWKSFAAVSQYIVDGKWETRTKRCCGMVREV